MKLRLSITFALLAMASAGWFLVSERTPVRHEGSPVAASTVISQERPSTVGDAGNDSVITLAASRTIQHHDPRAETARRPVVSNPPSSTMRTPEAQGLSSPPVKISPSTRPHQASTAISPTRPISISNERTRSKFSSATAHRNRARQGSSVPQPSQPPSSSVLSENVKPQNPEIVKPSEIPVEDITPADPAGVPTSDNATEDQMAILPATPQPAVWVDLGAASSLSPDKQDEIQVLAESLSRKITESGFDPASPEYQQAWNEAVVDSDQLFRQRYGGQAWMEHHIQAYHLAHPADKKAP